MFTIGDDVTCVLRYRLAAVSDEAADDRYRDKQVSTQKLMHSPILMCVCVWIACEYAHSIINKYKRVSSETCVYLCEHVSVAQVQVCECVLFFSFVIKLQIVNIFF